MVPRMTDGRLHPCEEAPSEAYLYQRIHTLDLRGRCLEGHVSVADACSRRWFGRPAPFTAEELGRQIEELLCEARYPAGVSSLVTLRLYASGRTELVPGEISPYSGYAFRSLQPRAVSLAYDLPFDGVPLSAREHAALAARKLAELEGAQSFVRIDSQGLVRSCDDAPLFAVKGKRIFTPPAAESVEFDLAARAIRRRGYELHVQPVGREQLPLFEELFYTDHRGITALRSCDGNELMHIIAEQVAAALD